MSTVEEKKNLEVVSEYFSEYWGKANPEIVDKLCSDDFVINYPMHGPRYGKAAAKQMLSDFKEVSDAQIQVCMPAQNADYSYL